MRIAPLLIAAALLAAGCLAPGAPLETGGDGIEPEARPDRPPSSASSAVQLRPESEFAETAWGFVRKDWEAPTDPAPSIFYMEGYGGASAPEPTHYLRLRDGALLALSILPADRQEPVGSDMPRFAGYTQVRASLRGTGCSGGTFVLFSPESAQDGYEAIEWIAAQNWTTPQVGMYGFSYSGLTAFYVAATAPPHLAAVVPNAIIHDLYRSIAYPGGVPNVGFPVLWASALRPRDDVQASVRGAADGDEICAQNTALRTPASPADQGTVLQLTHPYDASWYRLFSLYAHAPNIRAPISMAQGWQDEQVGALGGSRLFAEIPEGVPKRLVATNGGHFDTVRAAYWDDLRWFDHYLKGEPNGVDREPPVTLRFETHITLSAGAENYTWGSSGQEVAATTLRVDNFPPNNTAWTRLHLRAGGRLDPEPPAADEAPDAYPVGSPRQSWYAYDERVETRRGGPDLVAYDSEAFERGMVVAGPIAATLHIATTAPDMDLFVALADVHPDGKVTYLQRGLLRASHRAVDHDRSAHTPAGDLTIPHHPHLSSEAVPANTVQRYEVQVHPLAHIFHPGHRLRVEISTPPLLDGLWGYSPLRLPGVNLVHHSPGASSSILLPVLPWEGSLPAAPECGGPQTYRCLPGVRVSAL